MPDQSDDMRIAVWSDLAAEAGVEALRAPLVAAGFSLLPADGWADALLRGDAQAFCCLVLDLGRVGVEEGADAVARMVDLCGGPSGPAVVAVAQDLDWATTAALFRAGAADALDRTAALSGDLLPGALRRAVRERRAAAARVGALKNAVARLSESEQRHRALFEQSRAAAFLIDPVDGRVRDVNPAAARFVGRPRDSLRDANFFDLSGVRVDAMERLMAEARSADEAAVLLMMTDAKGKTRRVAVQSGPMLLDGEGLVLAVLHDVTDAAAAERRADALSQLMERILAAAGEGVIGVGRDGAPVFFNPAAERLTGWTAADLYERPLADALWPDADPEPIAAALAALGPTPPQRLPLTRRDGARLPIRCVVTPLKEDGRPSGAVVMLADMTEEIRANDALAAAAAEAEEARRRLHDAIGAIAEGFVYYGPDDRLVLCNEPYRRHMGPVGALLVPGADFEELVRIGVASGLYDQEIIDVEGFVAERMRRHRHPAGTFERLMGGGRWLLTSETRTADGGYVAVTTDITAQKHLEAKLRRLATTDPLTGAANRRSFLERGEAELERARRSGRPLSLLMLDLDHFKRINDQFGHAAGDAVLKAFAVAAQETLRRIDVFGRLGGEEFVALLPDTGLTNACEAGERLRRAVAALRVELGDGRPPVRVTVSIGAAEARPYEEGLSQALVRADKALYGAKSGGRDRVASAA